MSFADAVLFVIDDLEGAGKVVDDSGGVTRYGISSRSHPGLDVENLTREAAESIYQEEYWGPAGCETLPWPLSLVIFQAAVNMGVPMALNISADSFDASEALLNQVEVYARIVDANAADRKYLHGWMNRVVKVWNHVKM